MRALIGHVAHLHRDTVGEFPLHIEVPGLCVSGRVVRAARGG